MDVEQAAQHDPGLELTARELDVLQLVANGLSAKEVALKLDITSRTVESHIGKLRLKTRSRNSTHMVAQAIQLGLLSRDKL